MGHPTAGDLEQKKLRRGDANLQLNKKYLDEMMLFPIKSVALSDARSAGLLKAPAGVEAHAVVS